MTNNQRHQVFRKAELTVDQFMKMTLRQRLDVGVAKAVTGAKAGWMIPKYRLIPRCQTSRSAFTRILPHQQRKTRTKKRRSLVLNARKRPMIPLSETWRGNWVCRCTSCSTFARAQSASSGHAWTTQRIKNNPNRHFDQRGSDVESASSDLCN